MANAFSPGVEGNAKGVRVAAGLGRSAPGKVGACGERRVPMRAA
jgi:hypothetical protein